MKHVISIVLILAVASFEAKAADEPTKEATKMTASTIEPLVREYAFRTHPKLNGQVNFKIEEFDVSGLWETLKVQLFVFHYLSSDGTHFNVDSVLYYDGKLFPVMSAFGGQGPMSGLMLDKTLYYTYSWGSGEHRSHVGRLTIECGKPKMIESKPYFESDLFVTKVVGNIQVEVGEYKAFNKWKDGKPIGSVKVQDSVIKIVDAKGNERPNEPSK